MASLNKVFLIGRLTRDPDLRYIPSGAAVVSFGLATSRVYTTQSGEKKEEVCFVRVVAWGRQAEICNQYLNKGRLIFIEGRLQYRSWETPEGGKRSTLEIRADRVQFLERKPGSAEAATENLAIGQNAEAVASAEQGLSPADTDEQFEDKVPF